MYIISCGTSVLCAVHIKDVPPWMKYCDIIDCIVNELNKGDVPQIDQYECSIARIPVMNNVNWGA